MPTGQLAAALGRLGGAAGAQHPPRWLRVAATWVVIFPSVAVGQWVLAQVEGIGPVGRAAVVTAIVVPAAAYLGTPAVLRVVVLAARLGVAAGAHARRSGVVERRRLPRL